MFIGRERELAALNKLYESDKFEFVVIYGRRRVGKTALISRFIDDKNAIYFMGVESNAKQNLENFSKSIMSYHTGMDVETSFLSFQAALEYVFKLSEKERIILAIDEYPYVARSSKSLASTIQLLIDQYKNTSKLMLILCGSSMSYMEDHVLAYKAPLYGRRTAQMKILPLLNGECPVEFSSLGRWWGNDPKEKRQAEIDILAEQDKNTALFGECKWTNEKVDLGVLETLVKRSELFSYKNVHYYLFTKIGFTKGCADRANEMGNVTLVRYEDIVSRMQ